MKVRKMINVDGEEHAYMHEPKEVQLTKRGEQLAKELLRIAGSYENVTKLLLQIQKKELSEEIINADACLKPCDEDCYLFRCNTCQTHRADRKCDRQFKPTNQYDDAGARITI